MSSHVTTVAGGGMFTIEDVTTRGLRRQSEVAKDIAARRGETIDNGVPVPVSLTPESIKTFFSKKRDETIDPHEKGVYDQTIRWIDELFDTKKKLVAAESKLDMNTKKMEEDI